MTKIKIPSDYELYGICKKRLRKDVEDVKESLYG